MYLNKLLQYYAFVGKKIVPHFFLWREVSENIINRQKTVIFTNYKVIYISMHGSSIVYQQMSCFSRCVKLIMDFIRQLTYLI